MFSYSKCETPQPFEKYEVLMQEGIPLGFYSAIKCSDCQCPPCQGCGERSLEPKAGGVQDPKTYYCEEFGKLKFCSGCKEWKNLSAYSATAQTAVAAAKHIMNQRHLGLVCKALKEK